MSFILLELEHLQNSEITNSAVAKQKAENLRQSETPNDFFSITMLASVALVPVYLTPIYFVSKIIIIWSGICRFKCSPVQSCSRFLFKVSVDSNVCVWISRWWRSMCSGSMTCYFATCIAQAVVSHTKHNQIEYLTWIVFRQDACATV